MDHNTSPFSRNAVFSLHLYKYAFLGLALLSLLLIFFSYSSVNLDVQDVLKEQKNIDVTGYREGSQFEQSQQGGFLLDCVVTEPKMYELCGLKFQFPREGSEGRFPSFSKLSEVEIKASIEVNGETSDQRVSLTFISLRSDIEYDEDDLSTTRFQSVHFLPEKLQTIKRDRIVVDAWWDKLFQVPYNEAHPDFSQVVSIWIYVEPLGKLEPGRYKLNIETLLLKHHFITPSTVNLSLALVWPSLMLIFLCHYLIVKRAEMHRLKILADCDLESGFVNLHGLNRLYAGKLKASVTVINIKVCNYLALQREFSKETVIALIKATFTPFTGSKNDGAFLVKKQDENILLVVKHYDEALFGRLISASQKGVYIDALGHLRLDVKMGIAQGEPGMTMEEIIAQTTIAIDAIIDGEPSYKVYQPSLKKEYRQARFIEQELRTALANKAFYLVYMPVYDSVLKRICGAEALLRTTHLPLISFSPEVYVKVAEKVGLIREIDFWVLEQAILALKEIRQRDFVLSVNISSRELMDTRFADELKRLIDQYDVIPGSLCLEVTETFFIDVNTICFESIQAIRNLGVKLSLDDFGTGHASLQHLLNIPINEIKIDRSFVWSLGDEKSAVIVDAIVSIARICQYDVVAEGVETGEQLNKLIALGCRYFQGYLIAKPDSFEALLTRCIELKSSPRLIDRTRAAG